MQSVSVVIATYNMGHLILETINSCINQRNINIEVVVYDDCSTDDTKKIGLHAHPLIRYVRGGVNLGVGAAFNEGIKYAKYDLIVLMCADDLFTNDNVLYDMCCAFERNLDCGHVSRWYHQFVGNDPSPVRAWRTNDPIIQANNPSGLMFYKPALKYAKCSNKMMIETSALVSDVINQGWGYHILKYDTIKARVHKSTSTQKDYWLKRRVSSPVLDWWEIGAKDMAKDYVSLIQIKNGFTMSAVLEEIGNFIRLRPLNAVNPKFWFWVLVAVLTPRRILRKLPPFYRKHIGVRLTQNVKRP